jgi:hypothetical protein
MISLLRCIGFQWLDQTVSIACGEEGAWLTPDVVREIDARLYTGKSRFDYSPNGQNKKSHLDDEVALQFLRALRLTEFHNAIDLWYRDVYIALGVYSNSAHNSRYEG